VLLAMLSGAARARAEPDREPPAHVPPRAAVSAGAPRPSGMPANTARVKPALPKPSGSASFRDRGELAELFHGRHLTPEELAAKLAELRRTRAVRREAHRAKLRADLSPAALENRALVAELRTHARRMALLDRAKLVASTDLAVAKRAPALARIDRLVELEGARHERRMAELQIEPSDAGVAAVAVASDTPVPPPLPSAGNAP
jgi:hypothetical protein